MHDKKIEISMKKGHEPIDSLAYAKVCVGDGNTPCPPLTANLIELSFLADTEFCCAKLRYVDILP